MFEQTFLTGPARVRTGWSMLISMTTQVGLVSAALLVPLIHPEILPASVAPWDIKIAPPPGRPAVPPPPETASRVRPERAAPPLLANNILVEPRRAPGPIPIIIDEPEVAQQQDGGPFVPGAIGGHSTRGANSPSIIALAPPPPPQPKTVEPEQKPVIRIRQGGDVQHGKLIHQVTPQYPPLAVTTRVQGKVTFTAVINTQGQIVNLQVLGGHPMLVPAATEAVRQWRYRPTMLNGDPVEVVTVIEVTFTLNR